MHMHIMVNTMSYGTHFKVNTDIHCVKALQYAHAYYGKHSDKIRANRDLWRRLAVIYIPPLLRECRKVHFVLTVNVNCGSCVLHFSTITITLQGMGNHRDLDKYWTNGDTTWTKSIK